MEYRSEKSKLIALGSWRANNDDAHNGSSSWPEDYVYPSWDPREKDLVLSYLNSGNRVGYQSSDQVDFCKICRLEQEKYWITDGEYQWPAMYIHYIEAHLVKPPEDFIRHVHQRSLESIQTYQKTLDATVKGLSALIEGVRPYAIALNDKSQRLFELCSNFIDAQRIGCPEAITQNNQVIENAYDFIERICDIVGYYAGSDDKGDGAECVR